MTGCRDGKDFAREGMCSANERVLSQISRAQSRPGEFVGRRSESAADRVQMYIGDGAKLVRDAFELAKEKAPAIIFIDELDAIGTKRFDSDKSGDREVQRTMLELLNQLDGFSSDSRIKVNRGRLLAEVY